MRVLKRIATKEFPGVTIFRFYSELFKDVHTLQKYFNNFGLRNLFFPGEMEFFSLRIFQFENLV